MIAATSPRDIRTGSQQSFWFRFMGGFVRDLLVGRSPRLPNGCIATSVIITLSAESAAVRKLIIRLSKGHGAGA